MVLLNETALSNRHGKIQDDYFNRLYKSDQKLGLIFRCASIITIIIACPGLLRITCFTTEQRTKEIGIRKALGASVSNIVQLLSKEFVKWVLLANIIA